MSNQSNQKMETLVANQLTLFVSAVAMLVASAVSLFYSPVLIMGAFFAYQTVVRFLAYFHIRAESRFLESLWTAPAKFGVATVMVVSIPADNFWGPVWVGLAMLFVLSGIRSLSHVIGVLNAKHENTAQFENMLTARQRKRADQIEESLLADFLSSLGSSDQAGEGRVDA